jgi:hypothetical protein
LTPYRGSAVLVAATRRYPAAEGNGRAGAAGQKFHMIERWRAAADDAAGSERRANEWAIRKLVRSIRIATWDLRFMKSLRSWRELKSSMPFV